MVSIVNGYVCFNCTDVANARKGVNPAHPDNPLHPQAQNALAAARAKDNPAVILSGALNNSTSTTNANGTTSTSNTMTQNAQPPPTYPLTGTQLDVSA